jgi:hypothetical protein
MYAFEGFGARSKKKVVELVGFVGVSDYYADAFLQSLWIWLCIFCAGSSELFQWQAYIGIGQV